MNIPSMHDLMSLCEAEAAFRFNDHQHRGRTYRVFTYSFIAGAEMWRKPFARECRGHTYDVDTGRLVSLPMPKFFNLGENEWTQGLDITAARHVMTKLDGSLVSTFWTPDGFGLKTKGSLTSDQALAADVWLTDEQRRELQCWVDDGWTVNMEWIAPNNRIVIAYEEPRLVVLNARAHTGFIMFDPPFETLPVVDLHEPMAPETVLAMEGAEGVVVVTECGEIVKVKSDWYVARHRVLDMLASDRRWVELCLSGDSDDVLPLVREQPLLLERFELVNSVVWDALAWAYGFVDDFHAEHGHLDRKEFALAGQGVEGQEKMLFPLLMQRYSGQDPNAADLLRRRMDALILPQLAQQKDTQASPHLGADLGVDFAEDS